MGTLHDVACRNVTQQHLLTKLYNAGTSVKWAILKSLEGAHLWEALLCSDLASTSDLIYVNLIEFHHCSYAVQFQLESCIHILYLANLYSLLFEKLFLIFISHQQTNNKNIWSFWKIFLNC